ncbi:MAG TPA: hypothetical protein VLT15_03870 [Acidimicrobiia bacterium]|nr:hypothetical protein [Acidimicrobiia bacterium]
MVAGVVFVVGVEELIPGADDERCAELKRPAARAPLTMSLGEAPRRRCPGRRGDDRSDSQLLRARYFGRGSLFVEQDTERNLFVFDESLGVAPTAGADGGDTRTGVENLVVSLTDLTGPLPTSQSAEVAEKQDHLGMLGPEVPETVLVTVWASEELIS